MTARAASPKAHPAQAHQRRGDAIPIPGDYQARAIREGFVVQRFWHRRKLELIDRVCPPTPGSLALDVGCGSGVVAEHLAQRAGRVDAVDANPAAIQYARGHAARDNLHFHLGYAQELGFQDGTFDFAYCMEVIEHLYEGQIVELLAGLRRVLRPGGRLMVTTPNYRSFWPLIERLMDALHLAPRMMEDQHVTHLTAGRLRRIAARVGLREVCMGRFCGLAPFASVLSWRLGAAVNAIERRLACPLGNLLYAVWERR